MENEKNFNPNDSLALIESMINTAKNRFSENGHLYLLWGWTVLVCSIAHFVMIQLQVTFIKDPGMVWMLTWIAAIYQMVFLSKKKKQRKVKTYTDEIGIYVWMAFGVMMLISLFLMAKNNMWDKTYPVFLTLYGMPTFLSGVVLRFKPLRIGGIICWILAIASAFVSTDYQLLLLAAAVIAAWITPGYLLRAKYKTQTA
jgi:hypothetical protein